MSTQHHCCLCAHVAELFYQDQGMQREFWKCQFCQLIFVPAKFRLSSNEEVARYRFHKENLDDLGHQKYLGQLINEVGQIPRGRGLDFGCGKLGVLAQWMVQKNPQLLVDLYDINFHPHLDRNFRYDFIVCSEVVEHFHHPAEEFKLIFSLLKSQARLFIQTSPYPENKEQFATWFYRRDPTHVAFFHDKTFKYLSDIYQLQIKFLSPNLWVLQKGVI